MRESGKRELREGVRERDERLGNTGREGWRESGEEER